MNEIIYLHAHITQCILAITVLYIYTMQPLYFAMSFRLRLTYTQYDTALYELLATTLVAVAQ